MKLETVIGLEIHAQLSTKSKMFCGCDNDAFGAEPNTRVCPICMGFPGQLPLLNAEAVKKGVRGAAALGCKIQEFSKFDRKNYFYPDLPTGFQISQFDQPVSKDGKVEIEVEGEPVVIGITRVHLENDAGKLTHVADGTLCDYNRAGTPLVEIVTEPDIRSPREAQILAKEIQKIVRFVDASDADMEKGMMRFDASISLRPEGEEKFYPRTEIKNLNSFSSLFKALNYELKRQTKLWEKGTPPDGETTVGWLEDQGKTVLMRDKESAMDYRYFPEPDVTPLTFTPEEIEEIENSIPELPLVKFKRYQTEFELHENDALKLAESIELSSFFEEAAAGTDSPKKAANLILGVILADSNWKHSQVTPTHIVDVLKLLSGRKISSTGAKEILVSAMENGQSAKDLMIDLGLEQVSDTNELEKWCDQVISENTSVVEDYKAGKDKVIQFLVGQVMKMSRGSANPPVVLEMLKKKLG